MPAIAPRTDFFCGSLRDTTGLGAGYAVPGTACDPASRGCGAVIGEKSVVPFPTLASVRQLYHSDPELSIGK
jgi:hypothetical protein